MFIQGQKVVCINDNFSPMVKELYNALPIKDVTYTVRDVLMGRMKLCTLDKDGKIIKNLKPEDSADIAIRLVELVNGEDPFCAGQELSFKAERFAEMEEKTEESVNEEIHTLQNA